MIVHRVLTICTKSVFFRFYCAFRYCDRCFVIENTLITRLKGFTTFYYKSQIKVKKNSFPSVAGRGGRLIYILVKNVRVGVSVLQICNSAYKFSSCLMGFIALESLMSPGVGVSESAFVLMKNFYNIVGCIRGFIWSGVLSLSLSKTTSW